MAHNSRTRADLAAWASGVVTQAEFNKLDMQAFQSINGDLGGVWAPSTVIEIGGQGLLVSGDFTSSGDAEFTGTADFFDVAEFHDTVQFHDPVTFISDLIAQGDITLGNSAGDDVLINGASVFEAAARWNALADFYDDVVVHSGATLSVYDDAVFGVTSADLATFEASFRANSPSDFYDDVTVHSGSAFRAFDDSTFGTTSADLALFEASARFNAPSDFYEDVTVHTGFEFKTFGPTTLGNDENDEVDIHGTLQVRNPVTFLDVGRVPLKPATGSDANLTFVAAETNFIFYGDISTDRTCSIDTDDTNNGDFVFVTASISGSSHALTVVEDGGGTLLTFHGNGQQRECALLAKVGGSWRVAFKVASNAFFA